MKRKHFILPLLLVCAMLFSTTVLAKQSKCNIIFDKASGEMYAGADQQFLLYENILPGDSFSDSMFVDNQNETNTYSVYMQASPINQSASADLLLQYISLTVSYDNEVIYNGNLSGREVSLQSGSMEDLIYLGEYKPGEKREISTEISLAENLPAECFDIETQIDWQFYAVLNGTVIKDHPLIPGSDGPDTGDDSNLAGYIILTGVSGIAMFVLVFLLIKKFKKNKPEDEQ